MDFPAESGRLAADLTAACGVTVVWKDADPAWPRLLPKTLAEHRNPHCLAVKEDPTQLQRCIAIDGLTATDWIPGAPPRIRTCPFGVTEILVPVWSTGAYRGTLLIGPWSRGKAAGLLPFPGSRRALAIARLAAAAFAELCDRRQAALAVARAQRAGDDLMAQAVAWIDAHLDAGIGARRVAQVVGLSPSRFVHRFKEATGTPFGPHLRGCLMREAARLLADPVNRIADVSAKLGFANQNWFATAFRKHHGCTPTAWRKRRPGA